MRRLLNLFSLCYYYIFNLLGNTCSMVHSKCKYSNVIRLATYNLLHALIASWRPAQPKHDLVNPRDGETSILL